MAALGIWLAFTLGRGRDVPPAPPAPAGPKPTAASHPPAAKRPPAPVRAELPRRWVPKETRLFFTAALSQLAGQKEFDETVAAIDPMWAQSVGRVLRTFALRPRSIRRLNWSSTNLADWTEYGVVVIQLEEGQDATVYRVVGEPSAWKLGGVECRRQPAAAWPHPFAVVDATTIVTGREELLRGLASPPGAPLASVSLERFFKATSPDTPLAGVLDLDSARAAGWRLPIWWMDAWPAGRAGWHTIWETPQGVGVAFRGGERLGGEVSLHCPSAAAADKVYSSLAELLPAAKGALEAEAASIPAKLRAGRLNAASAEQYTALLRGGLAALQSARCETVEQTVWLRTGGGPETGSLVTALLASRPAVHASWLDAARTTDEARHASLLSGLSGYRKAEGHFPDGAGGGSLLPPETRLSWIATMLPYYGHLDWHRELEFGYSWNSAKNRRVTQRPLDGVVNPALGPSTTEAGFPVTHYVGVAGLGADAGTLKAGDPRAGVFGYGRSTRLEDIRDGASNTIAILGASGRLGPWGAGGDATVRPLTQRPYVNGPDGFGSGQPDGMLAGMADGSVRFVSKDVDPVVLEQLATMGGREATTVAAIGPTPAAAPAAQPAPGTPPAVPATPKPGAVAAEPEPPRPGNESGPDEGEPIDVESRLAEKVPAVNFPGLPLVEAVRTVEQLTGLHIVLDVDAMARLGVSPRTPVKVDLAGVTAGAVLEAMLSPLGLGCTVEKDVLVISAAQPDRQALREVPYTVSDLTGPAPASMAALAELMRKLAAPESWQQAGGRGTVEPQSGVLRVLQTDAVHYQVFIFCEKLRVARGHPPKSRIDPARVTLTTRLRRAEPRLSRAVSANFYQPAPLEQILLDLEQTTGATLVVDWLALADEGIAVDVQGTLSVQNEPLSGALAKLLEPLSLAYRVVDAETIQVTTPTAAGRMELEFYPVGDLLARGITAASLQERITKELANGEWVEQGGAGVVCFDEPSACLIVLQPQAVQGAVEALLNKVREEKK